MRRTFRLNSLLAVLSLPTLSVLGALVLLCIVLPVTAQGASSKNAFFQVCAKGTVADVRQALDAGAKIDAKDKKGITALMYAARDNVHPEVITILLDAAAEFNRKSHWYKLGKKVDINDANKEGKTALMFAVENNSPEVMQVLLNAGADASIKDKQNLTVLMAYAARDNAEPMVMEMLLKAVAGKGIWPFKMDVNDSDKEGKTALMYAAEEKCNPEVVVVLLKAGADINAMDKTGKTALERLEANKFCQKSAPAVPNTPTTSTAPTQEEIWQSLCTAAAKRQFQKCLEALHSVEKQPSTEKGVKAPHDTNPK